MSFFLYWILLYYKSLDQTHHPRDTQDHYPPVFGGACCLWWGVHGARREKLPLDREAFEERFLLVYTNQPHHSGVNNWEVIKRFLDGDSTTRQALETIGKLAVHMRDALVQRNMGQVASLIKEEWWARRELAPAVSNPELESILAGALSSGATSGKVCGAGGGGCILIAVNPETRLPVKEAVLQAGGTPVEFHVAPRGLQVT